MLHGSPEIHGNRAELDLDRIIFTGIQTENIYTENDMMTSIAIRFGIGDIVTFPDKDQIRLFFQHIDQIFNITDEITDNADAGDVLQKILCIFKSRFFPLADQFFFDEDVVCEPKWSNWFASYRAFQEHYAGLAQQCGVDLFIAGCEMVQTERREAEWREVIAAIRRKYDGPVSYNTDKYQEHNVKWWDAVDVISSSGYYPIDDWDNQLDRIEQVVKKFDKPFFFAEAGCMSVKGSNQVPNDWGVRGDYDEKGQADWFQAMFDACEKRDWVGGFGIWEWAAWNGDGRNPVKRGDYEVYGKAAADIIYRKFSQVSE